MLGNSMNSLVTQVKRHYWEYCCSPKKNGVYNVGTGISRSFQDIADILQMELKSNLDTKYFENPYAGYQTHTQANIESAKKNIDFEPIISLEQGIKLYIPEIKRTHREELA